MKIKVLYKDITTISKKVKEYETIDNSHTLRRKNFNKVFSKKLAWTYFKVLLYMTKECEWDRSC